MYGFTWDDENLLLTDLSETSTLKRREEKRREEKRRENSLYFDNVNLNRKKNQTVFELFLFLFFRLRGAV